MEAHWSAHASKHLTKRGLYWSTHTTDDRIGDAIRYITTNNFLSFISVVALTADGKPAGIAENTCNGFLDVDE